MLCHKKSINDWQKEHSYFMSVDVPSDVPFAEFILSDEYNLFEYLQEADRKGMSMECYTNMRYRGWLAEQGKEYQKTSRGL